MIPGSKQPSPPDDADDLNRDGELTWRFRCRRSGRCCQVKGGVAWVSDGEQQALAKLLGLGLAEFASQHVRELTDPVSGARRKALRDREDGACELLDGSNECSVYEARPQQCRDFPHWDSITGDAGGFERAQRICPGIEAVPGETLKLRAVAALEERLASLPGERSAGCAWADAGAGLHVSGIEAERIFRAAEGQPTAPAKQSGKCPLHDAGQCKSPAAKPIACLEWETEPAREDALAMLHDLEIELGYPRTMGAIPDQISGRESDLYTILDRTVT
jgi:Fe-S-cluster containining protein